MKKIDNCKRMGRKDSALGDIVWFGLSSNDIMANPVKLDTNLLHVYRCILILYILIVPHNC